MCIRDSNRRIRLRNLPRINTGKILRNNRTLASTTVIRNLENKQRTLENTRILETNKRNLEKRRELSFSSLRNLDSRILNSSRNLSGSRILKEENLNMRNLNKKVITRILPESNINTKQSGFINRSLTERILNMVNNPMNTLRELSVAL